MSTLDANARFSELPSIDIQRSRFHRPSTHLTTMNASELIPLYWDEVLPGDTCEMDLSALVRMNTPFPYYGRPLSRCLLVLCS